MAEIPPVLKDRQGDSTRPVTLVEWVLVFLAALLLYAATANRGAQWQDSGEISLRIYRGELVNVLGLALTHPLHFWLGRLMLVFPRLEPVFAITLISSLGGALTVANLYGCVRAWVGRNAPALFAAASLGLANSFWHLSTLTEVYTLTTALFTAECWCLIRFAKDHRRLALWGMLFCNGLGLANHLQAGLTTPVLAVVVVAALVSKRARWSDVLIGAALWLAGSLPYTWLVAAQAVRSGALFSTLRSALFGTTFGPNVLNTALSARMLGVSTAFILFNFPNLLLPAAGYGIAVARRLGLTALARRALLADLVIHAVFVLRYNVIDQYTFFLPVYTLLCLFGGVGAAALLESRTRKRKQVVVAAVAFLLATPATYWVTTAVLRHYDLLHSLLYHKPYRDDYTYLFIPWAVADRSADLMSRKAVELAAPDGLVIVEDSMARFAVEYRAEREEMPHIVVSIWPGLDYPQACVAQILRARATVEVGSPVVFVPLDKEREPEMLLPQGEWKREGDIYFFDTGEDSSELDPALQ